MRWELWKKQRSRITSGKGNIRVKRNPKRSLNSHRLRKSTRNDTAKTY